MKEDTQQAVCICKRSGCAFLGSEMFFQLNESISMTDLYPHIPTSAHTAANNPTLPHLHHLPIAIAHAIAAIQAGTPVILLDDHDREDEADLIIAAETLSVPVMAQMIRDGSGIVCLCLSNAIADHLALAPMVADNHSRFSTAFTVSIEAKTGVTTGVSAQDRVTTILAAIADGAQRGDVVSPGHVFPLRARDGGVLERGGHTEGSVDLALLAGFSAAAVLCELMNPDGTMMRGAQLHAYAQAHQLPMLSIAELKQYRLRSRN